MPWSKKSILTTVITLVIVGTMGAMVYRMVYGPKLTTKSQAAVSDAAISFSEANKTVRPNELFSVSITLSSPTQYNISAADIHIAYPKNLVKIEKIEPYIDPDPTKAISQKFIYLPIAANQNPPGMVIRPKENDPTIDIASVSIGSVCGTPEYAGCTKKPSSGFFAQVYFRALQPTVSSSGTIGFYQTDPRKTQLAAIEVQGGNIIGTYGTMNITITIPPTPTPTPRPTLTPTPTPTRIPLPTATLTPRPTLSLTPTPTRMPVPTVCIQGPTTCSCPADLQAAQWLCSFPTWWSYYRAIFIQYFGPNNALERCFHTTLSCTQ